MPSYTCDTTYVHYYLAIYQVSLDCEEAVLSEFGLNGLPCLLAKFCRGSYSFNITTCIPSSKSPSKGWGGGRMESSWGLDLGTSLLSILEHVVYHLIAPYLPQYTHTSWHNVKPICRVTRWTGWILANFRCQHTVYLLVTAVQPMRIGISWNGFWLYIVSKTTFHQRDIVYWLFMHTCVAYVYVCGWVCREQAEIVK